MEFVEEAIRAGLERRQHDERLDTGPEHLFDADIASLELDRAASRTASASSTTSAIATANRRGIDGIEPF